jgi:hypothetical protein
VFEKETVERRWIILGEDGRFVSIGRFSKPSEAEIHAAEAALQSQHLSGWLAIMSGNPYAEHVPHIIEVQELAKPTRSFAEARADLVSQLGAKRS